MKIARSLQALAAAAFAEFHDRKTATEAHAIKVATKVREFLDEGLSSRVPGTVRRAFRMPHQGAREAARRVRQGKAGTGGPYHLRARTFTGDPRCGCRECVQWRRAEVSACSN